MKRIVVSVINDLVTDQRVHKICTTLTQMNFEVLLIGRKLPNSKKLERDYNTTRLNLIFDKGILFYAEYNIRIFFKLLFTKKDILLANDLDTLLPNYIISKTFKKKLIYDSHELFTELPELVDRPKKQKIWLLIEEWILPKLKNTYTVCNSIANYYNAKYNTNFKVIKNVPFPIKTKYVGSFPFEINSEKIILYQGALNKGRGLELIIKTMQHLNNITLVIIGGGEIENELKQKVTDLNLDNKIKFIARITPKELQSLTPLADLGISIEEDLGLNYRYALPNKIFDYIQAQVPILVSNLDEMKEIVNKYNVGEIILNRDPKALANQITAILQKNKSYYSEQLKIASKELTWENEKIKLIEILNNLE